MNSKHKLKRIKWGTLITISCLIGAIFLNTSAKSLTSAKISKKANNTCNDKKNDVDQIVMPAINIDYKTENGQVEFTIKVSNNANKNQKPKYWIFIANSIAVVSTNGGEQVNYIEGIIDNSNNIYENGKGIAALINETNTPEYTFNYNTPDDDFYTINVVAVYASGLDNDCLNGLKKDEAEKIAAAVINTGVAPECPTNSDGTGECTKPYYKVKSIYIDIENTKDGKVDIDGVDTFGDEINTLREAAEQAQENATKQSVDWNGITSEGATIAKNGTKFEIDSNKNKITIKNALSCNKSDVYKEIDNAYNYSEKNKKEYYYEKQETVSTTCKKTCKERVTVEYGPPVATKAGMCFEYKVKVSSKVACKTEFTGTMPKPETVCNIYPVCNAKAVVSTQAGPDEEFDSCIDKCDNGNYTQKCINKCYKEVYENVNNKKLSYETEKNVQTKFLSETPEGYEKTTNYFCSKDNDKLKKRDGPETDPTAVDNNFNDLYNAIRSGELYKAKDCKYIKMQNKTEDGKTSFEWNCKNTSNNYNTYSAYWYELGAYYFYNSTKAKQTVQSIAKNCSGELRTSTINPNKTTYVSYYIDKNGFKRARYRDGTNCDDTCYWTTDDDNDCWADKADRDNKYKKDLEDYINKKNECTAAASCSTSTATFTISANNVTETENNKSIFKASIDKNGKEQDISPAGLSPIIDKGGCYNSNQSSKDTYMTEWSFPGSWRNNKNGTISQTQPSTTNGWSQIPNYFCTSLNSNPVNSAWWNWAQNTKLASKENYEDKTLTYRNTTDITYNIKANTTDFGYFNWNISIQCFYAIPDATYTCTENCDDDCIGSNCDTGAELDYQARSVDNDDLFPDSSRKDETTGNKYIGFNWTSAANENTGDTIYEIKPAELLEDIQKNEVYTNDKLEYSFVLGRTQLNKLRGEEIADFTKGKFDKKNVGNSSVKKYSIWKYTSNIIRNSDYVGTYKINRNIFCNNWVDNSNCKTY